MSDDVILEMTGIEKSFIGISVLKNARFTLRKGEVHALMGGNGAGKSTLMKILTGVHRKDAGEIRLAGQPVEIHKPDDAERNGIAMIFQEFSLIPTLTVAQNIFLKRERRVGGNLFISDRDSIERSREILRELHVDIDPNALVGSLSVGFSQMVEIAKALSKNARILIMDEPTSSLSESETESLFEVVHKLKRRGISIIYISHRMAEIFELCDRVTVMRDGGNVLTADCKDVTMGRLIETMLGADTSGSFAWHDRRVDVPSEPVLTVRNLRLGKRLKDVSFDLHAGEIVGLAGLMGSGRTEIAEAIFGIRSPLAGEISIRGKRVTSKREAIRQGVALVPEDRRKQGLILDHSIRDNMILPNLSRFTKYLFVNDGDAGRMVRQGIESLGIVTDGPHKASRLLSGGNQQKVVLAKWLAQKPKVLILDEPTIGVDIGAKSEIVEIVRAMADEGTSVLVISSEPEELLAISDRILVLHDGTIIEQLNRREVGSEEDLHHAIQGQRIGDRRASAPAHVPS